MRDAGVPLCAVVNARGVVLGAVVSEHADAAGERPAREVMHSGPQTIRSNARELPAWIRHRPPDAVLVTRSDGTLVGVLEDPSRLGDSGPSTLRR